MSPEIEVTLQDHWIYPHKIANIDRIFRSDVPISSESNVELLKYPECSALKEHVARKSLFREVE